jgi:cytochrome c biogenesis protein
MPPAEALSVAATMLGRQRFRLREGGPKAVADGDQGPVPSRPAEYWLAAEKGYLREAGNLLFHLALLGVLVSIAAGGLFGYKADKLMVEGGSFSDTATALDEFHPGRLVTGSDLAPFTIKLNKFSASYYTSGDSRGEPSSFDALIDYSASPGAPSKTYDLRINQPLNVDSTKVYLIGHGYAPVFTVTDSKGKVVYDEATPFIPQNTGTFLSDGVVKVPDAAPLQLGFIGVFVPSPISVNGILQSYFPAATNPVVSLIAYEGNLGENSGIPQSVYQLDTSAMTQVTARPFALAQGQSYTLPGGRGKITFDGYKQWVSLAITYDPGQVPALVCGILALAGLLLSFLVRRRRLFVRAVPAADGGEGGRGAVVTVGGLARTDASGGFEEEFAEFVAELRAAHGGAATQDVKSAQDRQPKTGA